ncbi:MAG: MFS transporter, partial [Mycetocola sp.]
MSTPAIPRTQTARSPRLAAAVLLSAAALALLNSTIANVALPSMQIALGLSPAAVSLTLAGWALAFALALIPAGKLGDRWGHKRVFLTGIAIFTVSSTLIALVQDDVQLIGLRLIQGLSGGLFYPAIAASLSMLFSGQARGRAFGALGGTLAAAAAVGPLLGGLVIELAGADLGWRLVFLLNLPLGLLILVGGVVLLPRRAGSGATGRVDSLGFALLALGLIGVLSALILGEQDGWPGWVWVVLALGIAVLVLFALWERRAQERGSDTVIAPALFQNRDFALSAVISFSQFAGFISIFYLLALLWQSGLGRSALDMGLLTLPEALAAVVGAALVQPLVTRWGSRVAV